MRRLLSVLFVLLLLAGPVLATSVTAPAGGGEDTIQTLRSLAEAMLKANGGTPGVGEELVTKSGGKAGSDTSTGDTTWQAALAKLGDTVQLNDLPSVIQQMRQSQGDTFMELQAAFRTLSEATSVSDAQRQELSKNLERQLGVLLDDQTILAGLQLRVQTALASPDTSPALRKQLTADLALISEANSKIQGYQSESGKMIKTKFADAKPASADPAQLQAEIAGAWSGAEAVIKEVQGKPDGLSQDFFVDGQDKLNDTLKMLGELKIRVQAGLAEDPSNPILLALVKQIAGYSNQAGMMLRDLSVVRIPPAAITEIQDLDETLGREVKSLREAVAGLKAASLTKEQLDALFVRYDEMAERYAEVQKLYAALEKSAAGQKYKTTEQLELESLWAQVAETFLKLGAAGNLLSSPDRDQLFAAYLKPAPLALINDITAGTLLGQPVVAKYLPVTPPAAHDDVSALLSGKLLGDVIVKDGITYGVTVKILGPTTLTLPSDIASIKQAQLEVFRIENGQYTTVTLGATFEVYADVPHAALSIDGSGVLSVFLNNTLGDKNMQGVLYKMDTTAALTLAGNVHNYAFNTNQGWYPFIDEDGKVQNLYIDGSGVLFVCADNAPCAGTPFVAALDFVRWTDALKAAHSNFTFNTAATPDELPTDVVAKRLTGETGVTGLGNYDYMSWGKWNDGAGVADTIYTNSAWIAGSLTPAADIPVTGSASYSGKVVGKLSESGAIFNIGGTTALTADFAQSKLTGTFNMTKNNAAWNTATVDARWGTGTGNIAGTLTTTGMSGAVNGNFFGPAANSVGGAWNLANTAGTDKAAGVFTGNKQ